MLLSASLNSFLLGLGVYLGYVWTRNLDELAGVNGSRTVFITYLVSLTLCYGIYALSGIVVARYSYSKEFDLVFKVNLPSARKPRGIDAVTPEAPINVQMVELVPPRTSESQSRPQRTQDIVEQSTLPRENESHLELIQALQEAAQLRRDSAAADKRIAQLYERLAQL